MLQYLVVLLDDTSIAFCHASNPLKSKHPMDKDVLKKAVIFGMKNNLMIQFVLPSYDLPQEYCEIMESIDNVKIGKDVQIFDYIPRIVSCGTIVLRIKIEDFINNKLMILNLIKQVTRLSLSFTDVEDFRDDLIPLYSSALDSLHDELILENRIGKKTQVNVLTDRLLLQEMSNCGAGVNNITIAPNGKFYICPAFYYDEKNGHDTNIDYKRCITDRSCGDLEKGLYIKNEKLLTLNHSPLCKLCDAYHCHRCVWLNQKLTYDINTPSHQQCVLSHVERNSSMRLSAKMRDLGIDVDEISKIDYLDPFNFYFN